MALRASYYGLKKRILDKVLGDYDTAGVMTNKELTENKVNDTALVPDYYIEKSNIASRDYKIGQKFILNGKICTVTDGDITKGDTLKANTNYFDSPLFRTYISNLPLNYDLDNLTVTGEYYAGSSTISQSILHKPAEITTGFRMSVKQGGFDKCFNGGVEQPCVQKIELTNAATPVIYIRQKPYNGSWSSWYKFTGTEVL